MGEKNKLIKELENIKLLNEEKNNKIENLTSELELIKDDNYIKKQNIKIDELKLKLEKTKTYSNEKEKEQNKTIGQLAKELRKLRGDNNEENKYDNDNNNDNDLQKILFAEEYTI